MDLGISGRQALVCGASRGLGFACAAALAAEGVDVTLVARNSESLSQAASRLVEMTSRKPALVVADITTLAGREMALQACLRPTSWSRMPAALPALISGL
jgi:3-oxoacyl-[acyl-carrier protein] reductase